MSDNNASPADEWFDSVPSSSSAAPTPAPVATSPADEWFDSVPDAKASETKKPAEEAPAGKPAPETPVAQHVGVAKGPVIQWLEKNIPSGFQPGFQAGLGDVGRSLEGVAAKVAPETFNKVASVVSPGTTAEKVPADIAARNLALAGPEANQPGFSTGRIAGQITASAPAMAAGGEVLAPIVGAATKAMPALKTAGEFLSGRLASNAVVNPVTNAVETASTVGNKLGQYAASGTNAAIQAVPFTALTSAGSNQPFSQQLGENAAAGAILGAATPGVMDVGSAVGNKISQVASGLKSDLDPTVQFAHEKINNLIGPAPTLLDTTEYVPGSKPTLAQAAAYGGDQNAGNVSALERVLKESNPAAGTLMGENILQKQAQDNSDARRNFILDIVKTPEDVAQAAKARSVVAEQFLTDKASGQPIWSNSQPANVQPVIDRIDAVLQGPSRGVDEVEKAMNHIKSKLVDKYGNLQTDPEYLYNSVVNAINTKLESMNPSDSLSQAMKAERPRVLEVKDLLNQAILKSTPQYSDYLSTYAAMSKPIDQMQALQKLNLVNPQAEGSSPTLSSVNRGLKKISEQRSAAGINPFKSLTDDQVQSIRNLQADLEREDAPNKTISTEGSPSTPKFKMSDKVAQELGSDKTGLAARLPGYTAGAGAGLFGAAHPVAAPFGAYIGEKTGEFLKNKMLAKGAGVSDTIANLLSNPERYLASRPAVADLNRQVGENPRLQNFLQQAVTPASIGAGGSYLGNISGTGNAP